MTQVQLLQVLQMPMKKYWLSSTGILTISTELRSLIITTMASILYAPTGIVMNMNSQITFTTGALN